MWNQQKYSTQTEGKCKHFNALYRGCSTDFPANETYDCIITWIQITEFSNSLAPQGEKFRKRKLNSDSSLSKLRLVMNPVLLGMISLWRSQVAKQGSQLVHQRPRCPMTAIRPTWWRVTGDSRGEGDFSQHHRFFLHKKTSSFGWFEDREFPLLLRENQFFGGRGPTHSSLCWRGDLVKTLSRWPCTHLDLKVECYDDLISLTETPPGRVSRLNTCDMLAMNVLLCLASTTLPKTMGLCICEDILAETRGFFGTLVWNAKKRRCCATIHR